MNLVNEITLDAFAGGGGASTGIEAAYRSLGLSPAVDIAVNHDEQALAMHAANHPHALHLREDVFEADMKRIVGKRLVRLLWMSPDCKHFSKAKGGKPVEKRIRGLAWVGVKWAKQLRPRLIFLENVEEFQDWGPLMRVDGQWKPDPDRKGVTFQKFVGQLRRLGYAVQYKTLRACDYGAPTIRRRLFLIARCDGQPIVWPKPTHGPGTGKAYRSAAECIDWSIPCPSIFERKRPLADNTLKRIARGVQRYVINAADPFIVPISDYGSGCRVNSIREPLTTITANPKGGKHALVVPSLVQTGYGERAGQAPRVPNIHAPLGTVVGGGVKHALVAAFLAQHNTMPRGGIHAGHDARKPLSTISASGSQQQIVTAFCSDADTGHADEVRAFLIKYYGNEREGVSLRDPMPTIPTRDRVGLVTVQGREYQIVDIGMRMLSPRELATAQGFPADYIIDRGADGTPLTKTAQVRMIGNSVSPVVATALITANLASEARQQHQHPQHGPRYCAEKLGRPLSSIQNFAKKHRIRKLYPRERFAQLSEPRSATS